MTKLTINLKIAILEPVSIKDKKFSVTKNVVSIALEKNIELMNGKVKVHVEHANANIIHQFVRKLKMLSSTQMK